ncbi:uncharacterized protein EV420DRAFT_558751 [Desarmillaria tabescens]|uniref:Uncharacterized protein n=1 Tax=Armillaria tabescens TaxID=1929756 RepID=A0AA39K9H2_ARMTA|nr:uncharacterized protein EV420DRAFT_558751 [Desarmillaria tabescens]KAK0455756.1 hypothetical protein EV420DRAFT_558751 [Desarmillaria tabescens]
MVFRLLGFYLLLSHPRLTDLRVPLHSPENTEGIKTATTFHRLSSLSHKVLFTPTSVHGGQHDTSDDARDKDIKDGTAQCQTSTVVTNLIETYAECSVTSNDTIVATVFSTSGSNVTASTSPPSQSSGLAIILPTVGFAVIIAFIWLIRSSIAPYVPSSLHHGWEMLQNRRRDVWQRFWNYLGRKYADFSVIYMDHLTSPVMLYLVRGLKGHLRRSWAC